METSHRHQEDPAKAKGPFAAFLSLINHRRVSSRAGPAGQRACTLEDAQPALPSSPGRNRTGGPSGLGELSPQLQGCSPFHPRSTGSQLDPGQGRCALKNHPRRTMNHLCGETNRSEEKGRDSSNTGTSLATRKMRFCTDSTCGA